MEYETFDFGAHTPTWIYPKGNSFKFGGGYTFSIKPQLPIQRIITLHFEGGMQWFLNEDGSINNTVLPAINLQRLCEFYDRHLTYKSFIYPHPIWGNIYVRFDADAPLNVPKAILGGSGMTAGFEIQLVEQAI